MSRPCVEHYPNGQNINERLRNHEKRIKELESKLGAASSSVDSGIASGCHGSHATPLAEPTEKREASTAADPSVSAGDFKAEANYQRGHGATDAARACDLAAAVTEWYESDDGGDHEEADLFDIVGAFVRGEPLPQKGG